MSTSQLEQFKTSQYAYEHRDLIPDAMPGEDLFAYKARVDKALHMKERDEAIASEARSDVPEGQVVAELQRGYLFGDELLRAAMVRVAASQ